MGKLSITVHSCEIFHSYSLNTVNPWVQLVVDGSYTFRTSHKEETFDPRFEETFVVDNTHRLAVIEVSLRHRTEQVDPNQLHLYHQSTSQLISSSSGRATGSKSLRDTGGDQLIGRCIVSTKRLSRGETKHRRYLLATPIGGGGYFTTVADDGYGGAGSASAESISVAGYITLSMHSDRLGEPGLTLNDELEDAYSRRLRYLFLKYDRRKLPQLDLVIADVREPSEVSEMTTPPVGAPTFEQLLNKLESEYGPEPHLLTLEAVVHGCSNLARLSKVSGAINAYIILRSECQEFVTSVAGSSSNPVWDRDNNVTLDVITPESFFLDITVNSHGRFGKDCEIGRARISIATLANNVTSNRSILICSLTNDITPSLTGMVHLGLTPRNFGLTPALHIDFIDNFYDRLNRFYVCYDESRIPQIDVLIHARRNELEEFMKELVREHGFEPGTIRLWFTLHNIKALKEDARRELSNQKVVAIITMGSAVIRSKAQRVYAYCTTVFSETFSVDVVRETDVIKVEVVKATDEKICYGRVDFTCMNIQRGVENTRDYYLVGNAGTKNAYFSGVMSLSLFSDEIGHEHPLDDASERMYAGRLRRFIHKVEPSKLHRVDVAMATVFDLETYMAQLSAEYGEEPPTLALYFTIIGCRQLKSKLGGINPYVVARVMIDSHETRVVKGSTEPDFFEFCEFYLDGLEHSEVLLVLMDSSGIGQDEELARVVIPLKNLQIGYQYSDWAPMHHTESGMGRRKSVGAVGVKFSIKDLKLIDDLRVSLVGMGKERRTECFAPFGPRPGEEDAANRRKGLKVRLGGLTKRLMGQMSALGNPQPPVSRTNSISRSDDASTVGGDVCTHEENNPMDLLDEDVPINGSLRNGELPSFPLHPPSRETECEVCNPNATCGSDIAFGFTSDVLTALDPEKKYLLVKIFHCLNLAPERTRTYLPNPYLSISTAKATYRTRTVPRTIHPEYNEQFIFEVDNPEQDMLNITALSDSAFGTKGLCQCILSMRNLQRNVPRGRIVSLVAHPLKKDAFQSGILHLALLSVGFGLDTLPSADSENRFRERIQEVLEANVPEELHRLEWLIGEYFQREQDLMSTLVNRYGTMVTGHASAAVRITISCIKGLTDKHGYLVDTTLCYVKLRTTSSVVRTGDAEVIGGSARFSEELTMVIREPQKLLIRVSVYPQKALGKKYGEFYVSLADVHRNVTKERSYIIIRNPGTANAEPCGVLEMELYSENFGSAAPISLSEEVQSYMRLRNYFMVHMPQHLHMVDARCSTTVNMEAYIQSLVSQHGREPGNYSVLLTVVCCRLPESEGASEDGSITLLVRTGVQHLRKVVPRGKGGETRFGETLYLTVMLPEQDEIKLIVLSRTANKVEEIGRTVVPVNFVTRGVRMHQRLPLVCNVGTKQARIKGSIDLTLYTDEFGNEEVPHSQHGMTLHFAKHMDREVDNFDRSGWQTSVDPYNAEYNLGAPANSTVTSSGDPRQLSGTIAISSIEKTMDDVQLAPELTVTLLGFRNFMRDDVYVKASKRGETLFRTKAGPSGSIGELKASGTTTVLQGEEVVLTFKVAVQNLLGNDVVTFVDAGIEDLPREQETERWMPMFDKLGSYLGDIGVRYLTGKYGPTFDGRRSTVALRVRHDIVTLMRKYSPKNLRKLELTLSHSRNIKKLHVRLRSQFTPRAVATIYCVVSALHMEKEPGGSVEIEAMVGEDTDRSSEAHQGIGNGTGQIQQGECDANFGEFRAMCSRSRFPPLRLDLLPDAVEGGLLIRVLAGDGVKEKEIGRAALSLRAILTPALHTMQEVVSVPLVRVQSAKNHIRSQLAGKIEMRFFLPAFERIPESLGFDWETANSIQLDYIQYYETRIAAFLKHYDPNTLVEFHRLLYDRDVASRRWAETLPAWLNTLVEKWGPERETFSPPPALLRDDNEVHMLNPRNSRSQLPRATSFSIPMRRPPSRTGSVTKDSSSSDDSQSDSCIPWAASATENPKTRQVRPKAVAFNETVRW